MTAISPQETSPASIPTTASAPLESHNDKELFAVSKVSFLIYGEKSNDRFAQSQAPAMGTLLALTNDCSRAGRVVFLL
jgi:hypothetical protein